MPIQANEYALKLHHETHLKEFERIEVLAMMRHRKIELFDPDSPRTRNVYEDIDQEHPGAPRQVLVTLYPEFHKDPDGAQEVVTHAKAIKDIRRMIDRYGYLILRLERDL